MRWCVLGLYLIGVNYRVDFGATTHVFNTSLIIVPILINAFIHYRLWSSRPVTAPWLITLGAMDIALISVSVSLTGGLESEYFIFFYVALVVFVLVLANSWLSFSAATVVALLYSAISLNVGPGINLGSQDEKTMISRIIVLFVVVASVRLIAGFERTMGITEVERERDEELQRRRVELSQVIHDTTAQSVYMIGLGIETAMELADKSNRKLVENLEATYAISKSAMWELRLPIDIGRIFEGRDLGSVLQSHAGTFTSITLVPAEVLVTGGEPPLLVTIRSALFSIAHNAITNAYRHSSASKVTIRLDFQPRQIRLSVSDDGIGLPANYASLGHGFSNMRSHAVSIGGKFEVETGGASEGTTISCIIPYDTTPGG